MKQAILYARFSPRPNAAECDSIESQFRDLQTYCEVNKIEILGCFSDANLSGGEFDRPGLWQAIQTAKKGQMLVVRNLDRLARDFLHWLEIEKACQKKGIEIHSANGEGTWDQTPQDQFIRRIFCALAEMQREITRAKTKAKMLMHQASGRRMTRPDQLPYGWQIDPDDPARMIPAPEEQAIIEQIQEMRSSGASYRDIERVLNFDGEKCRGRNWNNVTIRKICLREKKLIG